MSEDNQTVRKIYVLPKELADRIMLFQQEKRLPSEVQAVRHLLDEALKYRDTAELIVERFKERLKADGIPSNVAKEVLLGHPLVTSIGQEELDVISFTMKNGGTFRVYADGRAEVLDPGTYDMWHSFPAERKAAVKPSQFDDDIPF